jgi:glycosyltransferase involved in cell wall biosynthesis
VADGPVEGRTAPAEERLDGYRVVRLRSDVPGLPFTGRRTRWWTPIFGLRTERALSQLAAEIDLVHVHGLTDGLYGAWRFARREARPILLEMTLLGTDDPIAFGAKANLGQRWRERIYRSCDGYVAMSEALARRYREAGLDEDRLRVIPQGVDTRRFAPGGDRVALRRALDLPVDGPLCVFVGSLIERKGIDVLLTAWARIAAGEPEARLVLVGKDRFPDDPAATAFLERAWNAVPPAARERIVRAGLRDDVSTYLRAADVFLFPSRREGFGTVIIEAMACALPCVVADLPGITDGIFAADGRDGFVVAQDAPEALAERALALLRSAELREAVGEAARTRAVDAFDIDGIAARYVDWYQACLARPRVAP